VAQLYFRALGSLSVASYDSQGYGGGILSRIHTRSHIYSPWGGGGGGKRERSWFRHYAISGKVADSVPDEVTELFN
jgi:hypothetical protein